MDSYDVALFALNKLSEHGLTLKGWYFEFNRSIKAIGKCNYAKKRIYFSENWLHLPEKEIKDVILHEIAHALTPGEGHGKKWKKMCLLIGAKPERCKLLTSEEKSKIKYKYTATCKKCGRNVGFSRKWKYNKSCGKCSPAGFNSNYLLTVKQNY